MIKCANNRCISHKRSAVHNCTHWDGVVHEECGFIHEKDEKLGGLIPLETWGRDTNEGVDRVVFCESVGLDICYGFECKNCMFSCHNSDEFLAWNKDGDEFDMVDKVFHYQLFPEHGIEVRHVIARSLDLNKLEGAEANNIGIALKYLLRLGRKDAKDEDKRKAINYIRYSMEES